MKFLKAGDTFVITASGTHVVTGEYRHFDFTYLFMGEIESTAKWGKYKVRQLRKVHRETGKVLQGGMSPQFVHDLFLEQAGYSANKEMCDGMEESNAGGTSPACA